jgi:predicted dehydrogenase
MMNTINWGIIGCGDVTEIKSGPAFSKIPGSNLISVMRRDAAKAADCAKRHNVKKWYSDADDLMNETEINAVYIATPPAFHLPYVLAAIKKGLNIYVEKPVTLNALQSKKMADAVTESNIKLTVAHYRRALPLFLRIKELIDCRAIGEIRTVQIRLWQSPSPDLVAKTEANWRVDPELSGGGYFHDLAPHQIDLLLFYFGKPLKYHGFGLNQAKLSLADDHVCGQILFEKNIVVNGSWCFNVGQDQQADVCEIVGTEGKITFAFFGTTVNLKNRNEEITEVFIHPQHIEQPMIEKVIDYFNGVIPNPCAIVNAVSVMDIMDVFSKKAYQ